MYKLCFVLLCVLPCAVVILDSKISRLSFPFISRPKTLDDVSHQEQVVQTLRKTLSTGNLPHMLFYGPPGTGKTSTILAVARELYG